MIYRELVCWFNFSRVILDVVQHRGAGRASSNSTRNILVTWARRARAPPRRAVRSNVTSNESALARAIKERETVYPYRRTGPIRSKNLEQRNSASASQRLDRGTADTRRGESVRHPTDAVYNVVGIRVGCTHAYTAHTRETKGRRISVH